MTIRTLHQFEEEYDTIRWREPMPVEWPDNGRKTYACRVCIANLGFNNQSPHHWPTEDEALAHIRDHEHE